MELLDRANVQIVSHAADWKDAIRISTRLLESGGYVEACYKEAIISNVEKMGPYIVLAPYIALPHARPEQGVNQTQIAVTLFQEEVAFENKETPVRLFVTLAAADNSSHIDTLMAISECLQDEEIVDKILHARDEEELYSYFA